MCFGTCCCRIGSRVSVTNSPSCAPTPNAAAANVREKQAGLRTSPPSSSPRLARSLPKGPPPSRRSFAHPPSDASLPTFQRESLGGSCLGRPISKDRRGHIRKKNNTTVGGGQTDQWCISLAPAWKQWLIVHTTTNNSSLRIQSDELPRRSG